MLAPGPALGVAGRGRQRDGEWTPDTGWSAAGGVTRAPTIASLSAFSKEPSFSRLTPP